MKPVCLVIGAGAGIGGTVGKRFAKEGFHAVLCRRSNEEGLNKLVAEIRDDGGDAAGFLLNAVKEDTIEERVKQLKLRLALLKWLFLTWAHKLVIVLLKKPLIRFLN